jgi:hypothetical protein
MKAFIVIYCGALVSLQAQAPQAKLVRPNSLWPEMGRAFRVIGDRLEKSGSERLTFTGTILRSPDNTPRAVKITWEFPGKVHIEEQTAGPTRVTVYDDEKGPHGTYSPEEEELVEALINDTAEHFFIGHARAGATRFLGSGFSYDRTTAWDLYERPDLVGVRKATQPTIKLYCFNTATQLLERVRYSLLRGGAPVRVEVQIGGWRAAGSQQIPSSISRTENGKTVLSLNLDTTTVGAHVDDGAFQ